MAIISGGYNLVQGLLLGDNPGSITWVGLGTNGTAVVGDETALVDVYGETGTESEPTVTSAKWTISIGAGEANGSGTVVYQEVGLHVGSGGVLCTRQVIEPTTKDATVSFIVQVTLDVIST